MKGDKERKDCVKDKYRKMNLSALNSEGLIQYYILIKVSIYMLLPSFLAFI